MGWKPFEFGTSALASLDGQVGEGSGIVYSSQPLVATGQDGETYFVKGPEPEVVFAELAGCVLANAVGLTVPCARACTWGEQSLAGSRRVSNLRAIFPWLARRDKVTNFEQIYHAIVVDVWLGNVDRNMGNIVGSQVRGDEIEFVFIDFEKSVALRRYPRINSAIVEADALWPSGELGQILARDKPLFPPQRMVQQIRNIDENACRDLIRPVAESIGGIEWLDDSIAVLMKRATEVEELARQVWN